MFFLQYRVYEEGTTPGNESWSDGAIKTTALALVAMFAFSTAANAQFGKLLKKAKSAVMGTSSQDAYCEQQKKIDEMRKAQEKKNEEELAVSP